MSRHEILPTMFTPVGFGLEIGPSYNPVVPKSSGATVEIIDHTDQAGLVAKYHDHPNVDTTRIEAVDYIWDGRPMAEIIGKNKYYDYIVAAHVIEHTTNLLGFLDQCDRLLKDDGELLLIVPDKRYCFDVFRPVTSIGAVLEAHWENRTRHRRGAIFDHYAYAGTRGGCISWAGGAAAPLQFLTTLADAAGRSVPDGDDAIYVDCHAWPFTPSSFRLLVRDLNELGLLHLRDWCFRRTVGCEFFVTLSRAGSGCPHGRETLARMMIDEAARGCGDGAPKAPGNGTRWPLRKVVKRVRRFVYG
jgi:SAM-dependent methyltransferase